MNPIQLTKEAQKIIPAIVSLSLMLEFLYSIKSNEDDDEIILIPIYLYICSIIILVKGEIIVNLTVAFLLLIFIA